jgi:hypothetical protein
LIKAITKVHPSPRWENITLPLDGAMSTSYHKMKWKIHGCNNFVKYNMSQKSEKTLEKAIFELNLSDEHEPTS